MQSNLEDQAIKSALSGDWDQAIQLNQQILSTNPNHIPSLNRLARALTQTGDTCQAKSIYQQVLCLDKYNSIASKQLKLLKTCTPLPQQSIKITMTDFVEEPGKTNTYNLVRLGDSKLLSSLQPGQEVVLVVKNHWILVTTTNHQHIGCLTENVSLMLKQKIAQKLCFEAVIRTASTKQVSIFIRELHS